MPQIRISEESYRLLKERAKRERRTLSNMVEVLLIPTVDDIPPTGVDRTVTDAPAHQANTSPPDSPATAALQEVATSARPTWEEGVQLASNPTCTCTKAERGKKGIHLKKCPLEGKA